MGTVDDIRLKVERAEIHFEYFKAAVGAGDRPVYSPEPVDVHYEPERQHIAVTAKGPKPVLKRRWGILIGDVIHQLRAALDHLVYALATRTATLTERQIKQLSFPIFKDPAEFLAYPRISNGFLERAVGIDEFAEIKRAQPYERSIDPITDPLWILSGLDNIDKHRTVLVLDNRVSIRGTALAENPEDSQPFRIVKDSMKAETEVFNLRWPRPIPPTAVSVNDVSRYIVFAETEGLCDNLSVFPLVRAMLTAVDETVVKFERFFPA